MGRRRKDQNDEETKEKLTDKLGELFFSRGLADFTMDEISRFFHVSKKTLYRFFPSKEDMILHISGIFASRIRAFVRKKLEKIEARGPDEFVSQITEMISRFGSIMLSVPASILSNLESRFPFLYARIDAIRSSIISESFANVLEAGKRMGKVRTDIDTAIVSHIYDGMLRQIISRKGMGPEHAPYEIFMTVVKILFEGVLTPETKRDFHPESLPKYSVDNLWIKIRSDEEWD